MLLDDLMEDSPECESTSLRDAAELTPPTWLKVSEVDGILSMRWRWNHAGLLKWRHLFISVIATTSVTIISIAGAIRGGSLLPAAGLLLVALVGFGCTLAILTQLVNSEIIRFDGRELVIWHGPLFGPCRKRATRIPADQITSLCFTRSGQPPHFDYNLAYSTIDGRGWQLNCSLRDGAGAHYVRRRLDAALGLSL